MNELIHVLYPWLGSFFLLFVAHKMWDWGTARKLEGKAYYGITFLSRFVAVFVGLYGFIVLYGLVRGLMQ